MEKTVEGDNTRMEGFEINIDKAKEKGVTIEVDSGRKIRISYMAKDIDFYFFQEALEDLDFDESEIGGVISTILKVQRVKILNKIIS